MTPGNGELKRLAFTLAGAAVIGAWGFSATRASQAEHDADIGKHEAEIRRVETESRRRDEDTRTELREIREGVSELSAAQREFRARVLEAIRRGDE